MKYLMEWLKKLVNLRYLELNLQGNRLVFNQGNWVYLRQGLKELVNLEDISLDLVGNDLKEKEIQEFRKDCLGSMAKLKKIKIYSKRS